MSSGHALYIFFAKPVTSEPSTAQCKVLLSAFARQVNKKKGVRTWGMFGSEYNGDDLKTAVVASVSRPGDLERELEKHIKDLRSGA